jgi:hypothetical protein
MPKSSSSQKSKLSTKAIYKQISQAYRKTREQIRKQEDLFQKKLRELTARALAINAFQTSSYPQGSLADLNFHYSEATRIDGELDKLSYKQDRLSESDDALDYMYWKFYKKIFNKLYEIKDRHYNYIEKFLCSRPDRKGYTFIDTLADRADSIKNPKISQQEYEKHFV